MSAPRSGRPDRPSRRSGREDRGGIDREAGDTAADRLIAAIEDGTLRATWHAETNPEWLAKYGAASWKAALFAIGYGPFTPEVAARRRERQDTT